MKLTPAQRLEAVQNAEAIRLGYHPFVPFFLVREFESGSVPCDEPPGMTERAYAYWLAAGGEVRPASLEVDGWRLQVSCDATGLKWWEIMYRAGGIWRTVKSGGYSRTAPVATLLACAGAEANGLGIVTTEPSLLPREPVAATARADAGRAEFSATVLTAQTNATGDAIELTPEDFHGVPVLNRYGDKIGTVSEVTSDGARLMIRGKLDRAAVDSLELTMLSRSTLAPSREFKPKGGKS